MRNLLDISNRELAEIRGQWRDRQLREHNEQEPEQEPEQEEVEDV